jgi:hypothetical protein
MIVLDDRIEQRLEHRVCLRIRRVHAHTAVQIRNA